MQVNFEKYQKPAGDKPWEKGSDAILNSKPQFSHGIENPTYQSQNNGQHSEYVGHITPEMIGAKGPSYQAPGANPARNLSDEIKSKVEAEEAERNAYADSHPGLSRDFARNISDILNQTKRMADESAARADGSWYKDHVPDLLAMREARMKDAPVWAKQDPMAQGMGYEWADNEKLKSFGWDDDYINHLKASHEFHPQEIEHLRSIGALRAPYAEYLAQQEEMRKQAEAEAAARAAQNSYNEPSYGGSGYYEAPSFYNPEEFKANLLKELNSGGGHSTPTQPQNNWDGNDSPTTRGIDADYMRKAQLYSPY